MAAAHVRVGRVYDPPGADDGVRVLVDRLWPRGLKKADADFDHWCRDVAPSAELRRWYGHDPDRFAEFTERYRAELEQAEPATALGALRRLTQRTPVTLLTATKDVDVSHAAVLRTLLTSP
jgi:uncharacterized protein YeaO (DUF488 family)